MQEFDALSTSGPIYLTRTRPHTRTACLSTLCRSPLYAASLQQRHGLYDALEAHRHALRVRFAPEIRLDNRAAGNAPGGRNILRERRGITFNGKTGDADLALRDRVNLTIGSHQWRHQQSPAQKAARIPKRGNADINA